MSWANVFIWLVERVTRVFKTIHNRRSRVEQNQWIPGVLQLKIATSAFRLCIMLLIKEVSWWLNQRAWSPAFSRAFGGFLLFTSSSHWLFVIFFFVLIGCCDYFGFVLTTLDRKALQCCFALFQVLINMSLLFFFRMWKRKKLQK